MKPKTSLFLAPALLLWSACNATGAPQGEELHWFESGWYVGGTGGVAITNAKGSDLDDETANQGFLTDTELDERDSAWKLYLGYRLEHVLGFEVGYTNLGKISSEVDSMLIDPDVLVEALAETQPFLGQGPTLAVLAHVVDTRYVDLGLRGGVWYWTADLEAVTSGGERVKVDQEGLDPFYGAFLLFEVSERIAIRTEYERYELDEDGADFLSVGLQIRLD